MTKSEEKLVSEIITNAVIDDAELMVEDHGVLTVVITCRWKPYIQGFGTHCLFTESNKETPVGFDPTGYFIWRLFEVVGVHSFKNLKGKIVRIKQVDGLLVAIGHPIEDQWFNPGIEFAELNKKFGKKTKEKK